MDKDEEREVLVNALGRVGGLMGPCRECGVGMGGIHEYPCSRAPIMQRVPPLECYPVPGWPIVTKTREELEEEYSQIHSKERS
jgi:hypothetical protein